MIQSIVTEDAPKAEPQEKPKAVRKPRKKATE